jgi:hypothetical protein
MQGTAQECNNTMSRPRTPAYVDLTREYVDLTGDGYDSDATEPLDPLNDRDYDSDATQAQEPAPRRAVRLLHITGDGPCAGRYVLATHLFLPGLNLECDDVMDWIRAGYRVQDFDDVGMYNVVTRDTLPEAFLIPSRQRQAVQPRRDVRLVHITGTGQLAGNYVLPPHLFTPEYDVEYDDVMGWIRAGYRVRDSGNVGRYNVVSSDTLQGYLLIPNRQPEEEEEEEEKHYSDAARAQEAQAQPRRTVRLLHITGDGEFAGRYVLPEDSFDPDFNVQCDEVAGWIHAGYRVQDFDNVGMYNVVSNDTLPEFLLIPSRQRLRD